MKKNIFKIILLSILVLPISVFAASDIDTSKLEYMNLPSTLEAEDIDMKDSYKETDDQATIYMFRGQGCSHCEEMLNYINTIIKDYGGKFKMRSFEVWNNEENAKLQTIISDKLKSDKVMTEDAAGVPFLIIGKTVVYGFDASKDETTIKDAIDKEYKSKDRYDVLKDAGYDLSDIKDASSVDSNKSKGTNNDALIVIIPLAIIIVLYFLFRKSDDDDSTNTKSSTSAKKESKKSDAKVEAKDDEEEDDEEEEEEEKPKKSSAKKSTTSKAKSSTSKSKTTAKKSTAKKSSAKKASTKKKSSSKK